MHRVLIRTRREDGTIATFSRRHNSREVAEEEARRHNARGKLDLWAEVVTEDQFRTEFPNAED